MKLCIAGGTYYQVVVLHIVQLHIVQLVEDKMTHDPSIQVVLVPHVTKCIVSIFCLLKNTLSINCHIITVSSFLLVDMSCVKVMLLSYPF